jgi:diguanylate cyclase (GGDEF)-like protein
MTTSRAPATATRLFLVYAAVSAVPVAVLGLVLASAYHSEADRRGLDAARSESAVIASTGVEPVLSGTPLRAPLDAGTEAALTRVASSAVSAGSVVRLRVRDIEGHVVFSPDGSGLDNEIDDEAAEAAEDGGHVEAEITRLNSDSNDQGPSGEDVVEVYRPLYAGGTRTLVGVLEAYLPYDPIRADVSAGLGTLYRDLAVGLVLLYVVLAGLCLATTRRLQRHARDNAFLADHDQLTGLPNRRLFQRRVAALAASSDPRGAVALVDVDRFKEVNDSLGHENGDALLAELARRLEAAARDGDTVARLGGDEFGIVLVETTDDDAQAALERLEAMLSMPLQLAGLPVTPEASIGFALLPQDATDAETLLQRADIAMYVAKAAHAGVVRYDPAQDHYDADRLAVVGELRRALENDELVLHYQPKMRLDDGSVTSVEALLRWNHPRHGLLYPDAFLPLAEQTGLMDPLTDWVVARAIDQMRTWADVDMATDLAVAVNVSARNLSGARFADRVLAAVHGADLGSGRLILEITETALFTDVERATLALQRLSASGVPISLDDFGQGQTSLGYLSRLPLAELKIDREFVTDMLTDRPHAAIVRSLVDLAHNLGFSVVAEGVEDAATVGLLQEVGCDAAQGFVLSKPLPPELLVDWLTAHRPAAFAR